MKKVKRLVGGAVPTPWTVRRRRAGFPWGRCSRRMTGTLSSSSTVFLLALTLMVGSTFLTLTTKPNRPQPPHQHPRLTKTCRFNHTGP